MLRLLSDSINLCAHALDLHSILISGRWFIQGEGVLGNRRCALVCKDDFGIEASDINLV